MSDPDISIQRKHMTSSSINELLPFRLSEYENYNLGVVLINPRYKVLDLPPGIGKFVEVEYLDGIHMKVKDLKSCDGLISNEAIAKSLPFVRDIIKSKRMKCLPKETLVTTFLGEHGKNSMVQLQKCNKEDPYPATRCFSESEVEEWFTTQQPRVQILSQKRLIDFQELEKYSYQKIKPLLKANLKADKHVHKGLSLVPVEALFFDSLLNPFGEVTDSFTFLIAEAADEDNLNYSKPDAYFTLDFMLADESIIENRKRMNFWEILAEVGGFQDGVTILVQIIMVPFSSRIFAQALVRGEQYLKPTKARTRDYSRDEMVRLLLDK